GRPARGCEPVWEVRGPSVTPRQYAGTWSALGPGGESRSASARRAAACGACGDSTPAAPGKRHPIYGAVLAIHAPRTRSGSRERAHVDLAPPLLVGAVGEPAAIGEEAALNSMAGDVQKGRGLGGVEDVVPERFLGPPAKLALVRVTAYGVDAPVDMAHVRA